MVRRRVGLALTAIGSFAIAAAVTLAFVGPALTTLPQAETLRSTARGTGVTVFSPATQTQRTDVEVVARTVTTGGTAAPDSAPGTALRTSGTVLRDAAGALISTDELTFCMDRRTAAAAEPCPVARHNGGPARVTGQVLDFPPGTQRRDHSMFDAPTGRAWPMLYDNADLVDGLDVDRFVQQVPATVVGRQAVPGALAGGPAGTTVQADIVYSATRTVWVEPRSGIVVKDVQEPFRYLRAPDGDPVAVLLSGSIGSDAATVADNVGRAEGERSRALLLQVTGPWGLGLVGLLALVACAVVTRRRATTEPGGARPVLAASSSGRGS